MYGCNSSVVQSLKSNKNLISYAIISAFSSSVNVFFNSSKFSTDSIDILVFSGNVSGSTTTVTPIQLSLSVFVSVRVFEFRFFHALSNSDNSVSFSDSSLSFSSSFSSLSSISFSSHFESSSRESFWSHVFHSRLSPLHGKGEEGVLLSPSSNEKE